MATSPPPDGVNLGEPGTFDSFISNHDSAVVDSPPSVSKVKKEQSDSASSSPSLKALKLESSRRSSSASNRSFALSDTKAQPKTRISDTGKDRNKMARSTSKKSTGPPVTLYADLADATKDATSSFTVIDKCTYSNKSLGLTENAMECDCNEEWDSKTGTNKACGDDSDCINRVCKMECIDDCACGAKCQNRRFQQQEYAAVSVIKTEKKGFGLRADVDLRPGQFIFEYIGEVINEKSFRNRMLDYDEEGIIHFYFMSLSKGEFVDATKKGNLGRFCNHSCSPNCYVDKWVVDNKLRMGIFAERNIQAGEELVFNYNVDRYGANPQPCYCGEPNCTGFIGGKTQTERATKLSTATIEALGIEDDDGWDTTVAKKPRKKKASEDDEEYVEGAEAKSLDPDGVTKVMAALMQCKEKWIAVKLLQRIQNANDEQVRARVIKLHGYQIFNSQLAAWKEDVNIILQIFSILNSFPRLTRNKIQDSKIEATVEKFTENEDEKVVSGAKHLIEEWSKLEVAYRIPRKKRDPNDHAASSKPQLLHYERRETIAERRSKSRTPSPIRVPPVPSGPRAVAGGHAVVAPRVNRPRPRKDELPWGWGEGRTKKGTVYYFSVDGFKRHRPEYPPRRSRPPPPPFSQLEDPRVLEGIEEAELRPLPMGWMTETASNGRTYYFNQDIHTWTRPNWTNQPDDMLPGQLEEARLKSVIAALSAEDEKAKADAVAKRAALAEAPKAVKEKKVEKWRSYDEEKRKKLYKNTIHPVISHVMNKYRSKLPKEDLKRFAKEAADKLVNSDFKAGRVEDPTILDDKREKKIKKFCQEFFDKAVHKYRKYQKEKAARKHKAESSKKHDKGAGDFKTATQETQLSVDAEQDGKSGDDDIQMSMEEDDIPSSPSPARSTKRMRDDEDELDMDMASQSPKKKARSASTQPEANRSSSKLNGSLSPVASVSPTGSLKRKFGDHVGTPVVDSLLKKQKTESPRREPVSHVQPRRGSDRMSLDLTSILSSTDTHADTSFAQKSMADILAEAQQASRTPSDEETSPCEKIKTVSL